MKHIFLVSIAVIVCGLIMGGASFSAGVIQAAQAAETQEKPLLIIRFNRPKVEYKQPLKNVVAKIIETKPEAVITLLTIVPVFDDEEKTASSRQIAEHNAKKVASVVEAAGVDEGNVKITYQDSTTVTMNEIHLLAK